jgi:hypothetical protein
VALRDNGAVTVDELAKALSDTAPLSEGLRDGERSWPSLLW